MQRPLPFLSPKRQDVPKFNWGWIKNILVKRKNLLCWNQAGLATSKKHGRFLSVGDIRSFSHSKYKSIDGK